MSADVIRIGLAGAGAMTHEHALNSTSGVKVTQMADVSATIATNAGGTSELITHGVNGGLIRQADPLSPAIEVSRLAHNPDIRLQYAAAGRATAEKEFDLRGETGKLKHYFERHLVS